VLSDLFVFEFCLGNEKNLEMVFWSLMLVLEKQQVLIVF
jgi:hypothetical protein